MQSTCKSTSAVHNDTDKSISTPVYDAYNCGKPSACANRSQQAKMGYSSKGNYHEMVQELQLNPRMAGDHNTRSGCSSLRCEQSASQKCDTLFYILLLVHLSAIAGSLVIILLNLSETWVGKELTGPINQNEVKQWALQITSKLLETLVTMSLSDIMFTNILGQLTTNKPLPLAILTAGLGFKDISYLWSEDFRALYTSKFTKKSRIIILLVLATMLAVLIGPSSATAMVPKLDSWLAGEISIHLDHSSQQLWPSVISLPENSSSVCGFQNQVCDVPTAWATLSDNLFSYWGHSTLGPMFGMPERVNVPGLSSLRNMNARFKGMVNLFQPQYTVATVQTAIFADVVNTLRMIWFHANSNTCFLSKTSGVCSYQDIVWSIDALQPVVYTACTDISSTFSLTFPVIDHHLTNFKTDSIFTNLSLMETSIDSQFQWVELDQHRFPEASIGAIIKPSSVFEANGSVIYACTINAQWAKTTIQTSFLNLAYLVDGTPPYFDVPADEGSTYEGYNVTLAADWAALAVSYQVPSQNNVTAFDLLMTAGTQAINPGEPGAKVEAALAVLLAEGMAQTAANAQMLGTLENRNDLLQRRGEALQGVVQSDNTSTFVFRTVKMGYGYGLRTTSAFLISTLISILVLSCYVLIAVPHVVTLLFTKQYVKTWRTMMGLFGLALHSTPDRRMGNMSRDVQDVDILKLPIEIVFDGSFASVAVHNNDNRYHQVARQNGSLS